MQSELNKLSPEEALRLMKAAPEMLAALKVAERMLAGGLWSIHQERDRAHETIAAAISLAEGK